MKKLKLLYLFVILLAFACSKDDDPDPVDKSSTKSITSFKFSSLSPEVTGTINETDKTIGLIVPASVSVTNLVPTITLSDKATISPASGTAVDFTNPVKFTVTAEDGTRQEYNVTVNKEGVKSSAKIMASFKFSAVSPEVVGVVNETDKTVSLTVPAGTAVTALVPTIVISEKATISPSSTIAQNFTNPVKYKVTAEDGTSQEYTVSVTVTIAKSTANLITSLKFSGLNPEVVATINQDTKHITAVVPNSTNRATLVPTITVSEKASLSSETPSSGVATDFTNPVRYEVLAEDGTMREYLVTVTLDPTVSFTVNPVTFLNLQQDGGMFIGGTNLGTFANNKFVLKNRDTGVITNVPATGGNATFLSARVPATLALGTNYQVTVFIGLESKILPETFTVGYHDIEFTSIIPNPVVRGHNIIITGKYFMSSGNVVKLESTILSIVSESATSIEVTVPASLDPGDYTLNITSNGKTFFYNTQDVEVQVDPETPIITDLNDDMGSFSPGETIIITGEKLNGASPTIYFTVFQNGVNSSGAITVNGDGTSATYVIPNDFVSGTYAITVKVDGFESEIYRDYIHIAP